MPDPRSVLPFADLEQQQNAAELGMWVFLGSELLLFGALLLGYWVYRFGYADGFADATRHTNIVIGAANTAILLTSSFMVAWAVSLVRVDESGLASLLFGLAAIAGLLFLVLKGFEYHDEYREHLVPGLDFRFDAPDGGIVRIFFVYYFVATGLHAIHITIGIVLLGAMAWRSRFGCYSPAYHAPPAMVALYWHFVDVIWIFLFALIYLPGRSS